MMEEEARIKLVQEFTQKLKRFLEAATALEALETLKQRKLRSDQSWFKWWYDKSEPGVFSASGVSLFSGPVARLFGLSTEQYRLPFWFSLCLSPVVCPIHSRNFFTGMVIPFFYEREREYTIEEAKEYNVSLFVLSGYVGGLLILQSIEWFFSVAIFLLKYPIFTCAMLALFFGSGYLIIQQERWLANGRLKMDASAAFILLWMGNYYNRTRIRLSRYMECLAESVAIRILASCIRRVLLLIFWQPNLGKLKQFEYPALDMGKRKIRLLRIRRRIPFCDLKCELVCVSLDKVKSYQAISYYWGEPVEKSRQIVLDNKQFRVTPTVYDILLRRSSIFAPRLVWIDSICINQEDNTEKADQVRMMNEIYRSASRVFVCLGNSPDAKLGISLLHELVLLNGFVSKSWLAKHILGFSNRIENGDEFLKSRLAALQDVLRHPWFGRIWIIQEVVVAKSLTVLYGNYELVWDYLILLMEIFGDPEMSEILSQFHYPGRIHVNTSLPRSPGKVMSLAHFQKGFGMGERAPLNQTLRMFTAFESTCPRDKIFALLGFSMPAPGILQLVDYQKKLSDVLYDVAQFLYFKEGSMLTVLHFAGIGWDGVEPGCPSWVPNWTISREPTTLAHVLCDDDIQYRAATQINSQISLFSEARLLKLRGQKLDKIKLLSTIPDTTPDPQILPAKELDEWSLWLEQTQLLAETYCGKVYPWSMDDNGPPTKQPITEAFWRTLVGDRTRSARPAPDSYSKLFTKIMSVKKNYQALIETCDFDPQKVKMGMKEPSYYKSNFATLEESMAFERDIRNAGWLYGQPDFPRNFCITDNGLMGMVPKYAKIGDVICLIYGAQVPFVLRPVSGEDETEYQLVGECYVHGMMDGQGFEMGNLEEDFTIR